MEKLEISYALSKQVPDMARGLVIHTNFGQLSLYDEDAKRVAALVKKILEKKLKKHQ